MKNKLLILLTLVTFSCSQPEVVETPKEIPLTYRGTWLDSDKKYNVVVTATTVTFTTYDGERITESIGTPKATTDWYFDFVGSNGTQMGLEKFSSFILLLRASRNGKQIQGEYYYLVKD